MGSIPHLDRQLVYECATCDKWWMVNQEPMQLSCAVFHAPGSCCHFDEREVASITFADGMSPANTITAGAAG